MVTQKMEVEGFGCLFWVIFVWFWIFIYSILPSHSSGPPGTTKPCPQSPYTNK
jgi:hypothetical protein